MSDRLSVTIQGIFGEVEGGVITLRQVLDRLDVRSFGILLAILALPSALPVPAPGYSVPFGIALIFLGVQMVLDRDYPWFPDRLLAREIRVKEDSKFLASMTKFVAFFERFIKPRLGFVYGTHGFRRLLGAVVLTCGVSMCIPVPLTNTAPALGIFLIGLGSLEEDGLIGIGGVCVSIAGLMLAATVISLILYLTYWAAGTGSEMSIAEIETMVKDFIKGLLGRPTSGDAAMTPQ